MRRNDAQHPIAEQEIGVYCAAGLPAPDSEIDRAGVQNRKTGENGVPETPALVTDAGSEDDPTPGRLTEISPLIGVPPGAASGINFLQAGDVGVDFVQHSGDSARVIAPVDANAGMNVISYDSNGVVPGGPKRMQWNAGATVDSRAAPTLGVQK
jgi:hypothetical protein